ncbi:hypothetical protein D3C84_493750 [compost metagenome]
MDHRGQEDVVVSRTAHLLRHLDHPWQQAWRRNDRQTGVAAEGVDAFQLDDEVQALVDQQGERVRRVQTDWRDDRRNLVAEIAPHPRLDLHVPIAATDEAHVMLFQLRQQNVVENGVLAIDVAMHQLADTRQCLVRLQAVGTGLLTGEGNLLLQARHTNFEELIQVAGEDQQEFQPLQQGIGLIQCLLQYADIELQLGQLTMNVQAAVVQAGDHRGRDRLNFGDGHDNSRLGFDFDFSRCFGQLFEHGLCILHGYLHKCFVIHLAFLKGVTALSSVEQRARQSKSKCHQRLPV